MKITILGLSTAKAALDKPPVAMEVAARQAASERLELTEWFFIHRQMGFFLNFGRIEHDDIVSPRS